MAGAVGLVINGRFRLAELAGQGGMGRVWRADDQLLGREVAVKEVLLPAWLSESERAAAVARAAREARAAARLNHPGVVAIYDVAEHDGAPWIVMELIHGRSLGAELDACGGRLPWERVANIGAKVADALDRAHAAGIVHRDLKPGNILLGADRVVVTDFGIAQVADATTRLTSSSVAIGTPQFMAPERWEGAAVGPAADMWSLGVTLYQAVEGSPPFDGPTAAVIFAVVVGKEPPPPRFAGPLAPVLTQLLAKSPDARPTAKAAAQALHAAAAPQTGAGPEGRQESPLRQRALAALDEAKRVAFGMEWDTEKSLGEIATLIATGDPDLAERIAADIDDEYFKAPALADIAEVVACADPRRGTVIAGRAEQSAMSITDEDHKAYALVGIAKVTGLVGRDRAAALADEIERAARTISKGHRLADTLIVIARAVSATAPGRGADVAERVVRIAADFTGDEEKVETLREAAKVIALTNPVRARRIAASGRLPGHKARVLTAVASVVAATDPDLAEQIAADISSNLTGGRAVALAEIARVVGATDPNRAAAIASRAEQAAADKDPYYQGLDQVKIARAVAVSDPARAEQIARDIAGGDIIMEEGLAEIAKVIAATDPDRAERIAAGIGGSFQRAEALAEVALVVAATDRHRAASIASRADRAAMYVDEADYPRAVILEKIAALVAVADPDRAEEIAAAMTGKYARANVTAEIAGAVAVADPDRAEQITASITEPECKVRALALMARSWLIAGN
jgi:tRNA A-37 threonylcarbamoyl transferase component Bud32